jgi:Na+-translocating ferredoxin:NAD+ oxidoreductase subunit G
MSHSQNIEINTASSDKKMLIAMGGIGIICAILIVLTYETTAPMIEKNKAEALERAIFKVLPDITKTQAYQLNPDNTFTKSTSNDSKLPKVYGGYDDTGKLKGIAIQANGKGYGEVLNILYGYDPIQQKIIGFNVLESKETPGIGDKIEKGTFPDNFKAMDVSLSDDGSTLKNEIITVKQGEKTQKWEIDGITGATVTSRAVGNILNISAKQWLPKVYKNVNSFTVKTAEQ